MRNSLCPLLGDDDDDDHYYCHYYLYSKLFFFKYSVDVLAGNKISEGGFIGLPSTIGSVSFYDTLPRTVKIS